MCIRDRDYDAIINSVKKTNRLVVLEEAWPFASVASEITYMVQDKAFDFLDAPAVSYTHLDVYKRQFICSAIFFGTYSGN